MGSRGAAFGRGPCLARFDTADICWIDSADVSDRVGGFPCPLGRNLLRHCDAYRDNFAANRP